METMLVQPKIYLQHFPLFLVVTLTIFPYFKLIWVKDDQRAI